jgi:hypothetical protein
MAMELPLHRCGLCGRDGIAAADALLFDGVTFCKDAKSCKEARLRSLDFSDGRRFSVATLTRDWDELDGEDGDSLEEVA